MKKKILIGALGLASVFAMTSSTDGDTAQSHRRFFGSEVVGVASCEPNGTFVDGSPRFKKRYIVEYYVFWIGVSESVSNEVDAADCDMPS